MDDVRINIITIKYSDIQFGTKLFIEGSKQILRNYYSNVKCRLFTFPTKTILKH